MGVRVSTSASSQQFVVFDPKKAEQTQRGSARVSVEIDALARALAKTEVVGAGTALELITRPGTSTSCGHLRSVSELELPGMHHQWRFGRCTGVLIMTRCYHHLTMYLAY